MGRRGERYPGLQEAPTRGGHTLKICESGVQKAAWRGPTRALECGGSEASSCSVCLYQMAPANHPLPNWLWLLVVLWQVPGAMATAANCTTQAGLSSPGGHRMGQQSTEMFHAIYLAPSAKITVLIGWGDGLSWKVSVTVGGGTGYLKADFGGKRIPSRGPSNLCQ